MKSAIAAAAVSCLIGAAGLGSAIALAGTERAAWPCSERPNEKHCKKPPRPSTETITQTIPGTTIVETQPAAPPVTVPPTTITLTVTTPAPPPVTVTSPPVTVTVKSKPPARKATAPKKKRHARHNVGGREHKPVHHGGGVTG